MFKENSKNTVEFLARMDINEMQKISRKEISEIGKKISSTECRFLVDSYYTAQRNRIRTDNQIRAMNETEEPNLVLQYLSNDARKVEDLIKKALDDYTVDHPVGSWMRTIHGIGPVTSAGLLAHLDINRSPTAGGFWKYAGISGVEVWRKGEKRPWNAELKKLCYLIGESFVKVSGKEDAYYGQLYKKRKELETFKNKNFEYAEQAKSQLTSKNYRDGTVTKDYLEKGMLSPAQIHARARRYAVKIFLSHLHEVMYKVTLGKKPPAPFAIAILGHAHVLEVPNPQYIREFVEPVEVDPTVESDED